MILQKPGAKEFILFLTDGVARVPEQAISDLLAAHGRRIKRLTCVAFGEQASSSTLDKIGDIFRARSIAFALRGAQDETTLLGVFGEAASRTIHLQ